MKLFSRILIAAGLVVASALPAVAMSCLDATASDDIVEGRLSQGAFKDAAGRSERAFIVALPAPTCLTGPDEFDEVAQARRVHIYSSNEAVARRIPRFIGKTVVVRGRPFGAHTAHHHAPIVMDITEIDTR